MTHAELVEIIRTKNRAAAAGWSFTVDIFKGNDRAIPPSPDQYRVRIVIGGMVAAKVYALTLEEAATVALTRAERRVARWRKATSTWDQVRA